MKTVKQRFRRYKGVRYVAPWKPAPLDFARCGALRKTIRKVVSGNRAQPERKSMKVYIVQRESLVGNEVDCFTNPAMAQEWATLVRSHVQIEETMDERLPEFIETYKRLPVIADDSDNEGRN